MHLYKFALPCELLLTSTVNLVLSLINSMTFVLLVQNLMAFRKRGRPCTALAQEDPDNLMDVMWEMAYAMREQAATTHQMMDQLGK